MNYLSQAILNLKPNSEFVIRNNDYSTIEWIILEGSAPTKKQIDDEIKRIKANEIVETEAKEAQRQAVLDRLGLTAEEAQLLLGGN